MTIPMVVMIISVLAWLSLAWASSRGDTRWGGEWLIQVCRIVFAASVLVVLWANMTERAF